jgi:hypothetical protein
VMGAVAPPPPTHTQSLTFFFEIHTIADFVRETSGKWFFLPSYTNMYKLKYLFPEK